MLIVYLLVGSPGYSSRLTIRNLGFSRFCRSLRSVSAMPTQYLLNPAGWMCSPCSISPAGERVFPSRLSSMMTSPSSEHPHPVDTLWKHSPVSMVRRSVKRRLTSVMRRKRFLTCGARLSGI